MTPWARGPVINMSVGEQLNMGIMSCQRDRAGAIRFAVGRLQSHASPTASLVVRVDVKVVVEEGREVAHERRVFEIEALVRDARFDRRGGRGGALRSLWKGLPRAILRDSRVTPAGALPCRIPVGRCGVRQEE